MDKDKRQDRIDDFLLDRLPPGDRSAFEEELLADPDLGEATNATRSALAAVELAEDRALKARLQQLEATLATAADPASANATTPAARPAPEAKVVQLKNRSHRRWLLAYAAALLLALCAGYFLFNQQADGPEQLARAYFEPFDNYAVGTLRGDDAAETAEAAAYAAYDAADYPRAETLLRGLPATPPNRFYLGQSLLAQGKYPAAADLFNQLRAETDFPLAPEAAYYAALAELGTGDTTAARTLLEDVNSDAGHPFHDAAGRLLAEL